MSSFDLGNDGTVVVRFELDPGPLKRGSKEAGDALDDLGGKAEGAKKKVAGAQQGLSAAFQTTGGGIQIAQGITQTATAFGNLNVAAAGFGASRVILEIGKTAQDFGNLRASVGASGGAFSALGAIMRAHPLLTIAGVVAAAASAMSLLGSETKAAATDWAGLAASMDAAAKAGRVADFLGINRPDRRGAIKQGLQEVIDLPGTSTIPLSRAQDVIGEQSRGRLLSELAAAGNREAAQFIDQQYYTPAGAPEGIKYRDPAGIDVTIDQLRQAYRTQFERETTGRYRGPGYRAGAYPGPEIGLPDDALRAEGPSNYVQQDVVGQAEVAREKAEAAKKAMRELVDDAREFGAQIGDAFFNVASGTQSARQAIAGIAADMARALSREAFAGLAGGIAGGFGATPAQGNG